MTNYKKEFKGINLACGGKLTSLKDWINADHVPHNSSVERVNLIKALPYEDSCFDVVYHSQFLEHLSQENGENFLKECFRILKPGGILRVVTPDLELQAKDYLKNLEAVLTKPDNKDAILKYQWIRHEMLDQLSRHSSGGEMNDFLERNGANIEDYLWERMGRSGKNLIPINSLLKKESHIKQTIKYFFNKLKNMIDILKPEILNVGKFRLSGEVHLCMYDEFLLCNVLDKTGFHKIIKVNANESSIKNWDQTQLDCDENGYPDCPTSLFMEATKPK